MTIPIIIITCIISIIAFSNRELFGKLLFNPYQVYHRKEYYRIITHGLLHADWWHLFVNMFVLFFFGRNVEGYLNMLANENIIKFPTLIYIILYLTSIIFSASIGLVRYKDNYHYNAVGASGAVSAVMFFSIFFNPWQKLYLYAAIPIPGIIFAVLYIVYSQYMSKRSRDNVAHDAHLLGAIFGFIFPLFLDLNLIKVFWSQLLNFG